MMRNKILKSICLISALSLVLVSAVAFCVMYGDFYENMKQEVKREASNLIRAAEHLGEEYLSSVNLGSGYRVTLVSGDGTVLFDSRADESSMGNHLQRPEVQKALTDGFGEDTRLSETIDEQTYYYAVLLKNGNILRVSRITDSVVASALNLLPWLIAAAGVILGVSVLAARGVTGRIIKPINEINLDSPESCVIYDELAPLLTRIRNQNRVIVDHMNALTEKEREFSTLTENMREGFILVNSHSEVVAHNESAARTLGFHMNERSSRNVIAFNRSADFQSLVQTAIDGHPAERVIEINHRYYQFMANPIRSGEETKGAVVLIIDITEREERERLRREFTANVSHELKTPLTSISGYAEIIKNGLVRAEDVPRFAKNIFDEAGRLITLINDIIELSQLDENAEGMQKEPVNLYDVAKDIVNRLCPGADKAGVTLSIEGRPCEVTGVRRLLDEMIYNLVDNAIKYNKTGGSVKIAIKRLSGKTVLSVSDTGIGIRKEEQERVFERFYRVDRSRSRDAGGTGLGLSIVKHGAMLHGAGIRLESELNKGTDVTITFKQ